MHIGASPLSGANSRRCIPGEIRVALLTERRFLNFHCHRKVLPNPSTNTWYKIRLRCHRAGI